MTNDLEECFGPTQPDKNLFLLSTALIAKYQEKDKNLMARLSADLDKPNSTFQFEMIHGIVVITQNGLILIPAALQQQILNWYHHFLCHPGQTHMEQTLHHTMTWRKLHQDVVHFCKMCETCQFTKKWHRKYDHLLPKHEASLISLFSTN